MTIEKSLDSIRNEFMNELDKNNKMLDKIKELQKENEQLERDLKAYRSLYTMKNEVCGRCMFADECIDANRVEWRRLCSSFHAKLENDE